MESIIQNGRMKDESFKDYKKRMVAATKAINEYLKNGTLFWDSNRFGTYTEAKKEALDHTNAMKRIAI